jgi:glycosyltransferase involved in cell wall biosynthesis
MLETYNRKSVNRTFSILLIGTQMTTGGAQTGLLDQARCFHARGCRVEVAFIYDKDGVHATWQQRAAFPIHNLRIYEPSANFIKRSLQFLKGIFQLWKFMRREKFDIVETFTHDSNLIGLPLAWLTGVPVRIATHRGVIEHYPGWRLKLHTLMINLGIADIFVAVSDGIGHQAQIEGVHSSKILVIRNGVTPLDVASVDRTEVRQKLQLKEDELFLLSVGRLAFQKGHDVLIDAVPALIQHYPSLTVNLCGDGPQAEKLHARIVELGVTDHVKLLGTWSNVAPLLAIADVFILPSRSEGLSRALLEAMAAGLPIVATKVHGVDDVVTDGVHGLLVPAENPDALTKALIQMVDHPEMRKQMGLAAQELIMKSYTTDVMFTRYFDVMMNLLNDKSISKKLDA